MKRQKGSAKIGICILLASFTVAAAVSASNAIRLSDLSKSPPEWALKALMQPPKLAKPTNVTLRYPNGTYEEGYPKAVAPYPVILSLDYNDTTVFFGVEEKQYLVPEPPFLVVYETGWSDKGGFPGGSTVSSHRNMLFFVGSNYTMAKLQTQARRDGYESSAWVETNWLPPPLDVSFLSQGPHAPGSDQDLNVSVNGDYAAAFIAIGPRFDNASKVEKPKYLHGRDAIQQSYKTGCHNEEVNAGEDCVDYQSNLDGLYYTLDVGPQGSATTGRPGDRRIQEPRS